MCSMISLNFQTFKRLQEENMLLLNDQKQGGRSYVDIIDNDIAIDNVSTVDIDKLIDIYSNTGLRY